MNEYFHFWGCSILSAWDSVILESLVDQKFIKPFTCKGCSNHFTVDDVSVSLFQDLHLLNILGHNKLEEGEYFILLSLVVIKNVQMTGVEPDPDLIVKTKILQSPQVVILETVI